MAKVLNNRIARFLASVTVSGFLLWLLTRSIDWQATLDAMTRIQWQYVPLLALVWALPLITRTLLWQALLNWRIPFRPMFYCLNIGFLINNTLPFRAGDLARAILVSRTAPDVSGWSVLGSIMVERILDILGVLTILGVVLFFLPVQQEIVVAGGVIAFGAFAVLVVLILMARYPEPMSRLINWFMERLPLLDRLGIKDKYEKAMMGVQALTTWRSLRDVLLWTTITWALSLVGAWILLLVLPISGDNLLLAISLALVGISLSTVVPLTLANVGPFEGAVVFALAVVGVPSEEALAFGLIWHVAVILTYAIWGTFSLLVSQYTLADFTRQRSTVGD